MDRELFLCDVCAIEASTVQMRSPVVRATCVCIALSAGLGCLVACGSGGPQAAGPDAGADAGPRPAQDAGRDGQISDGPSSDATQGPDALADTSGGPADSASSDSTSGEVGTGDASDGAAAEAGAADSSVPDVGPPDTGPIDSGVPDAIVVGDASCALIQPTGSTAVAYQIDPAHTGQQAGDTLSLPLCQRWLTDLGGFASYPLVSGGRVFVTVAGGGGFKSALYALDQHTGAILWGPIDLGGSYPWSNAAYDAGHVFVVNSDGVLAAFDATTGAKSWQVTLSDVSQAPPTAMAGFVYVSVHGTVSAVTEAAGVVAWSAPVQDGDESSPAVSSSGAYVSYACNQAYDFSPATGTLLWHAAGGCSGGGGKTVSLFGNEVYTRDDTDLILDAVTGAQQGTYSSMFIPAFSATAGYYTPDYKVVATTLATGTPLWTFSSDQIVTAPLVVGSHVVVGSLAGTLYALAAADGTVASSVALPEILGPDEQNVSAPLAGFAAADGMLFVPAGTAVVAF